jgi:predicted nucleic acid-binding protein
MPNIVYDTRFFIEHYYSASEDVQRRTKLELTGNKNKLVSAISIHEVYRLTLSKEGRETAKLRVSLISKDFDIVDVNLAIAVKAAEIQHSKSMPMADSLIAATCLNVNGICVSDDPHFERVEGLSIRWIPGASPPPESADQMRKEAPDRA